MTHKQRQQIQVKLFHCKLIQFLIITEPTFPHEQALGNNGEENLPFTGQKPQSRPRL